MTINAREGTKSVPSCKRDAKVTGTLIALLLLTLFHKKCTLAWSLRVPIKCIHKSMPTQEVYTKWALHLFTSFNWHAYCYCNSHATLQPLTSFNIIGCPAIGTGGGSDAKLRSFWVWNFSILNFCSIQLFHLPHGILEGPIQFFLPSSTPNPFSQGYLCLDDRLEVGRWNPSCFSMLRRDGR